MQEPPQIPSPGEVAAYVFTAEGQPWRKHLKDYARHNRHHATEAETRLWQALRNAKLGVRFRRQHAIGSYIVDFICIKSFLTIELDGEVHNESS